MVKQFQTKIDPILGDCNSACVATITGIPLSEFKNPVDDSYYSELQKTLNNHGWRYIEFPPTDWWWFFSALQNIPVIASVPSQMFADKQHALVVMAEETCLHVLHDPNPKNKPYDLTSKDVLGWSLLIYESGLPNAEKH